MQRHDALSDERIENWVVAYKMIEKVRCSADAVSSLSTAKVAYRTQCSFFVSNHTYTGSAASLLLVRGRDLRPEWDGDRTELDRTAG